MSDTNFKRLNELEVIEQAGESTYAVVEENGVPKRIPGKKIGGGLPEGGAPYQQLVTDGEGVAKWEEKPFYEKGVKKVYKDLFSGEFTTSSVGSTFAPIAFFENPGFTMQEGNEYKCVLVTDGETKAEFSGIAEAGEFFQTGIGFESVIDEETYECVIDDSGTLFVAGLYMTNTTYTIKVSGETIVPDIKPIDSKFMPEGYPRSETKEVTFFPETSVEFNIDLGDGVIQCSMDGSFEAIKPGKTYVVTVNGKSYVCKADGGPIPNSPYEAAMVGSQNQTADMPFKIYTHSQWSGDIMFVTRTDLLPNPSTFEIVKIEETIEPLDPKYLPVVVFSEVYDPETGSGTGECTCTHTFEEYVALVRFCNCPPRTVFRERSKTGSYNIFVDAWYELAVAFLGDYQSDDLGTISFAPPSTYVNISISYSRDGSITLEKN